MKEILNQKILVTGSAGFIGFHLVEKLLNDSKCEIVGLDVINNYYDINLKFSRLIKHGIDIGKEQNTLIKSKKYNNYSFLRADLANHDLIVEFMKKQKFSCVVNLAAQAGVRYSIDNPRAYTHSNIDGFLSILEGCRYSNVKNLIYASTSSLYGLNTKMPLCEDDPTEHPMAIYAATKKANEMMAHSYSHLFRLPTTGLRFFTVYGPWGRPDMALALFTNAILKNEKINVFNHGNMIRDFTYVDDIVESISRLILKPAKSNNKWSGEKPNISSSSAPYQIFNIGNSSPVKLMDYIKAIEDSLGIKAKYNYMDIQPGDVPQTFANVSNLENYVNFKPKTNYKTGILNYVKWFKSYYK